MTHSYNSVKEYCASKEYQQFKLRIPLSLHANYNISVKQLPYGITILENIDSTSSLEFDDPIINYANNKIEVMNTSLHRTPELKHSKNRRNNYRNNLNLWKSFFCSDDDIIYSHQGLSVQINISRPIDALICAMNSREIYFPLAFLENGVPIGGAYIFLWKSGNNQLSPSTQHSPISTFHSAACMFGNTLYGIDEQAQKHSLTDPNENIPNDRIIVDIENNFEIHPDEVLFQKTLINFIPLMKILAKNHTPTLKHQIPMANYILYGIKKYINGKMTRDVLKSYVKIIKLRAKIHESSLKNLASEYGINIEFHSTLKELNLDAFSENTITEELFAQIKFNYHDSNTGSHNSIEHMLFMSIVNYLASLNNNTGEIWKMIRDRIQENPNDINTHDLLQINYLDYSATLALIKCHENGGEICSIMPSHEKQIAVRYKSLFSEKFGNVYNISFLPSLHACIAEYKNLLFYLDNHIHEVNALLNTGITTLSALQTAAIALDSVELSKHATEQIWQLLLSHQARVKSSPTQTVIA